MRILRIRFLLRILTITACAASTVASGQAKTLTTAEARYHIGEQATVCGKVVSSRYAVRIRGRPTFLDLDRPFPNQAFTVLIWGENRAKFGTPENAYRDKAICVTAKITECRGSPEMIISDPAQLKSSGESSSRSSMAPTGATAQCRDGSYSFSHTHRGTCSHHGGVARWLQ